MVNDSALYRDVAAQFQTPVPGDVWSAYASTGLILRGLLGEISYEASLATASGKGSEATRLLNLHRHVANTQVTAWSVRYNKPGYMPDEPTENYSRAEWSDAVDRFRSNIESSVCGHDCTCDDGDMCHSCRDAASVAATLADESTPTGSEAESRRCPLMIGRKSPCGEIEEIHVIDLVTGRAGDLYPDD